jgi:glycerophosphoryl diester phosphodiesterase
VELRALATKIDKSENGFLSRDELAQCGYSPSQIGKIVKKMGSGESADIPVEAFIQLSTAIALANEVEALSAASAAKDGPTATVPRPMIMAHRGACGYNPPHTLSSYLDAVDFGADFVEYDVISTSDHHLITSHDVTLEGETNIASEFPARRCTELIASAVDGDARTMTGFFAKDFTLEEVQTLSKEESWEFRSVGRARAAKETQRVLTVPDATKALEAKRKSCKRNFGIVVELKRPTWHRDTLGLPMEEKLVEGLEGFGGPVCIQCFESEPLRRLKKIKPEWSYLKLCVDRATLESVGSDPKHGVPEDPAELRPYLEEIAKYADIVSPWKGSLVADPSRPPMRCDFIERAHEIGLLVSCYTFRSDIKYLHPAYGGNATEEFALFFRLGVDAVFVDFSDHAKRARDLFLLLQAGKTDDAVRLLTVPNTLVTGATHINLSLSDEKQIHREQTDRGQAVSSGEGLGTGAAVVGSQTAR